MLHLKQRQKNLKSGLLILLSLSLSACAHVEIKDAEWCGDMGTIGATCAHTLGDETRDLSKSEWDAERFGMVCTQADSFANWKAAILKLCNQTKLCTFDDKQKLKAFFQKIESINPKRF